MAINHLAASTFIIEDEREFSQLNDVINTKHSCLGEDICRGILVSSQLGST